MTQDTLPSPVSVPEGDDLEDVAYEIARWIDSDAVDGSGRFREIVARRITAALLSAESRALPQWQPIETAPKDGTNLLLFGTQMPHSEVTISGQMVFTGYYDVIDDGWCSTGSTWTGPFYEPAYWQPLPAPPSLSISRGGVSDMEMIPTDEERERAAVLKAYRARITELEGERDRLAERCEAYRGQVQAGSIRIEAAEAERDTATRALAVLDQIAWLAAEEDSWFGNENDIAVQRAAAERHRAAKTEGKGC